LPSLSLCSVDTDKNLPVLEGDHVRRPIDAHEIPMQPRDSAIGNEQDVNVTYAR
jgi:hypothetical protein